MHRRLVIVVRADPVICGHSGEARNLAEAAIARGFEEVRIVTWPIERLEAAGLPLKPLDTVMPYSPGITVERPDPVGDYKVVDGRYIGGLVGRLVELFTDGVPTVAMSLYLSPHTTAVTDAVEVARRTGLPVDVVTIAEAVGSDVTNVVRQCVIEDRFGAAAHVLEGYLASDVCVAVSQYTKDLIVEEARRLDERHGTAYARRCAERIDISYPAIDSSLFLDLDPAEVEARLAARGLVRDGYVFYLSRLAAAKGVDDLIDGFAASAATDKKLVIAGRGPEEQELRDYAAASPAADRIVFLTDVDDAEKPFLFAGAVAYALPTKPRPEFVETFGIALAEKALAGGGPAITTTTGGVGEAVGDTALIVDVEAPAQITAALDRILQMSSLERADWEERARAFALQFDRMNVFDRLFARVARRERVAA
ncbi:glycosyltransferase [Microbacterium excoecariae]|uniref:glycosyltransferase n=1 Tax=Microbacterium excoecariae TaxID=2715210 RepID=UPI00140A7062|nr:glycosyltransferase [Microbacterium excoecariae]NHI17387.1 glycosyltransferase family 4 protein [Microbacterium excoecariae]